MAEPADDGNAVLTFQWRRRPGTDPHAEVRPPYRSRERRTWADSPSNPSVDRRQAVCCSARNRRPSPNEGEQAVSPLSTMPRGHNAGGRRAWSDNCLFKDRSDSSPKGIKSIRLRESLPNGWTRSCDAQRGRTNETHRFISDRAMLSASGGMTHNRRPLRLGTG